MTKFNSFGNGKLVKIISSKELIERIFNSNRRNKTVLREMQIGVIFGHTSKEDIERKIVFSTTIKTMKILFSKGFGGFDGTISTKTIEDKTITILN